MSRMEHDMTPKTLTNIRVFGAEAFGNEIQWRLDRPVSVCVTASDEIMIADANHCVHVFDQRGGWLRTFGTPGDFKGKMQNILQICANKTGDFVVVAMKGRQFKFQMYDSSGNFKFEFGMKDAKSCHGIAIDNENKILSVDGGGKVNIFNTNGTKIIELKCKRVQFPYGIGVNDENLIFIGDRDNHCVQVYNYKGLFRYFIGGDVLTPNLIGLTISGPEDILLVEIRQGKLGVSLFKQDGTWRSYSEAPERFQRGVSFALLSNDNIVVTTKNDRAFIYEQTGKLRTPVHAPKQLLHLQPDDSQASLQPHLQPDRSEPPFQMQPFQPDNIQASRQPHLQPDRPEPPYQMQPFQPDNIPASHQPHLQPDRSKPPYQMQPFQLENIQASLQPHLLPDRSEPPYQMQPFQPDNIQASHQPHLQPDRSEPPYQVQPFQPENIHESRQSLPEHDNFEASHKPRHLPDNFPAASQHQHHGQVVYQAHYQQQLFHQNIRAPTQHQHRVPGGFRTPSRLPQNRSSNLHAFYSNFYLPRMEPAQPLQNIQPTGSQAPFLTQPLQPNRGLIASSHIQSYQAESFNPSFNNQRYRELGLHRPVHYLNNNSPLVYQQQQTIAGAPPQYLYYLPTVSAVPLKANSVGLPSRGMNYNEQYSPMKILVAEEQQAANRLMYEQHKQQYQQEQREKNEKNMMLQFDRETAKISEHLQALSLPSGEVQGFETPASDQPMVLLDLEKGPLAASLQATVDLNASEDLEDDHHHLLSNSLPCAPTFKAQQIQDPTCALPLRYDKMLNLQNPAPVAIPKVVPSRQYMSNCGYIKDFLRPCAVAVDSEDNVIVVDAGDNRVLVYNKHGRSLFSFGEEGSGRGQLVRPRKVAADPKTRSIVVLESTSIPQIKIFSSEGIFIDSFLSSYIDKPRAMTVGVKSEIAVVQFSDQHVVMHDFKGNLIRTIKCNDFKSPTGIAVGYYEFFISDSTDNCVKVYNFNGQLLHLVGDARSTPSPIGVAIASDGLVAVVDTNTDFRMTLFSPMGKFSAGYFSQKRHRNFEGFALTSTDDVVLICDDGKLWYYDVRRSQQEPTFCPEKWLTSSPRK